MRRQTLPDKACASRSFRGHKVPAPDGSTRHAGKPVNLGYSSYGLNAWAPKETMRGPGMGPQPLTVPRRQEVVVRTEGQRPYANFRVCSVSDGLQSL